jgi:diguanylate cyclase (GGDEF)-like protein/PAS domain S-box-containing protein
VARPRIFSSLKLRIAAFATVLFVAAIWGMAIHSAGKLRDDERKTLAAQQFAAASSIADGIGGVLQIRVQALAAVAAQIDPAWLSEPRKIKTYLAARHTIFRIFPNGVCAIGREGRCLADHPTVAGRNGAYFGDEAYFREVMSSASPVVGGPLLDKNWRQAAIVVAVPINDRYGETVGVLAGTIAIAGSDVFHIITHPRNPLSGNFAVIAPMLGVTVIDTDSTRILQPLPPAGADSLLDRARTEDFEGSDVVIDAQGVEQLGSAAAIPGTDWYVVDSLPTAQAFAPLHEAERQLYVGAALLSLVVAALIWLFVRRELAALDRSAKAFRDMTIGAIPFHPLPVEGSREIARMVENFNDLQEQIVRQQAAVKASEARFRQMFEGSYWITYLLDPATRQVVDANRAAEEFWGYSRDELRGMDMCRINTSSPEVIAACHRSIIEDQPAQRVWQHRLKSGDIRDVETFICPLQYGNRTLLYVVAFDITQRARREEQERLRNRIFELLARGGDLKQILDLAVRYVERSDDSLSCAVLLLDEEHDCLRLGAAGALPTEVVAACDGMALGKGICGRAAQRGERSVVEDVCAHPFCAARIGAASKSGIAACWSEPIRDAAGKPIGTLIVMSRRAGPPTPEDAELMQQAANLAAVAIEKKRSDAELQLASSVYQASDEAIVVTDAANLIVAVNPAFTRLTGYALEDVRGRNPSLLASGRTSRAEYEAMWRALREAGQWQGEIWNRRKNGEEYAEWLTINALRDTGGEVQRYIAMFSDITEKKRTAELVWRQANYDTLTGLPNRNLFYDRLHQEVRKMHRSGHLLALLYIDLDRFKEVNDAYGHDAGDTLLTEAAARISTCVRETDTVARLSGDEFAVVLPGVADVNRVEHIAREIVAHMAEPFTVGSHNAYVSASVGIAIYPNDAEDAETLLKSADRAMYAAKEGGRNGFSYFTDSMQSAAQLRVQLSASLREALAKGQFEVFYQPIVDLATQRIVKAEALLRWRHPEHGLIQPSAFIPLAEEIGLIGEIGDWVFRQSALVAKHWHDRHPEAPSLACPIQISVNKSPRQFATGAKQENWLNYLRRIGLPTQLIALEITESLFIDDSRDVQAQLAELRESGVQVALDDFGTGYSSMGYLNKFRVDYVKIDRAFVQGIADDANDRAIVEAIVVMAHKLNLKVIGEGVETERQRQFLVAAGCDYAQGFLFAKPLPQADFETLLFSEQPLPLPAA